MGDCTRNMDFNIKENISFHTNCDLVLIKDLVTDVKEARCLAREVQDLEYIHMPTDLMSAHKHPKFLELPELPHHLSQFVHLLTTKMRLYVENAFGFKSNPAVSITASLYRKGDYLLCHDDLNDDRHIAFVYYLTDEDWTEADGGALRFFNHDEFLQPKNSDYKEVFQPVFNSYIMFRVSETSHHEVQQVFSDKPRFSISGWFHYKDRSPPKNQPLLSRAQILWFTSSPESQCCLSMLDNGYVKKSYHHYARDSFCNNGSLFLDTFFTEEVYHQCVGELESCTEWQLKGPANHRKYDVVQVTQKGNEVELSANLPVLATLIRFMMSPDWLNYLTSVTGARFGIADETKVPPTCTVEIQRWKQGYYSLLADNQDIQLLDTLELTLFFKVSSEGLENVHLAHCFTPPFANQDYYDTMVTMKTRRMRKEVWLEMRKQQIQKGNSHKISTRRPQKLPKISAERKINIKQCAIQKVQRIAEYRERRFENILIPPFSNSGLLTVSRFCDYKMAKVWPYVRMTDLKAEPKTMFYTVTIAYIIADD